MRAHFMHILTGTWGRYGAAVILVALALIFRRLIAPLIGDASPYVFVLTAVVISAWYGGRGPGVLAAPLRCYRRQRPGIPTDVVTPGCCR